MSMPTYHRAAVVLAGTASAVVACAGAPAHADTTNNSLTLSGTTFQVGQTYAPALTADSGINLISPSLQLWDSVNGIAIDEGVYDEFNIQRYANWYPETPGVHQLFVTQVPTGNTVPAIVAGPITVTVAGNATAPPTTTICSDYPGSFASGCADIQGTPEVGCSLTITPKSWPPVSDGLLTGSAFSISAAASVSYRVTDNGQLVQDLTSGTAAWRPTTTGPHVVEITGSWQVPDAFGFPGSDTPAGSAETTIDSLGLPIGTVSTRSTSFGKMFIDVAAAGTSPCA